MSVGSIVGRFRAGAAVALRKARFRRYLKRASASLGRDLRLHGDPERLERSVKRAVRVAGRRSSRRRIEGTSTELEEDLNP